MSTIDQHIRDLGDACIHCGLCLPACPTYRETGNEAESPRGRLYLVKAFAEGRLEPTEAHAAPLDACVGCRACESACPAGVAYGSLLESAKQQFVEPHRAWGPRTWFWRPLLRGVLPRPGLFKALTAPAAIARRLLMRQGRAPAWLPATARRMLELLPPAQMAPPLSEWTPARGPEKGVVAFLTGCAMPVLYAEANQASVRMLARAGYRVWVPRSQVCCGAIHAHDGDGEGTRAAARANVLAFERAGLTAIVVNAAGCGAAMKHYGELLAPEPAWQARAEALAGLVRDFSEFLAGCPLPPPSRSVVGRVTYHDPCHLAHGQGVRQAPRALLRAVPGLDYVELPEADWCCGGAGSYTLLQAEMSDKLLAHKLRHLRETGATVLVTANPPCLMQLGMGLAREGSPMRLVHLAQFLDEAYDDR